MGDIFQLLSSNALQELYSGEKQVKVQILAFKRISQKLFCLKIRDLNFYDNYVCQEQHHMQGVIPGDLIQTERAFCISIPGLGRNSAMLGPTTLIARETDLDLTNLPCARILPEQFTSQP